VNLQAVDAQIGAERTQQRAQEAEPRPAGIPAEVPPGVDRRVDRTVDDVGEARRIYEEQRRWAGRGGAHPEFSKDPYVLQEKWVQHGGTGRPPPAWIDQLGVIHIDWLRIYP
jgi:hypothetical protein